MDSNRIEGSWAELKGKAKQQWGNLTDNELTQIGGKKDELIGRIQARYGYSKDKAQQETTNLLSAHPNLKAIGTDPPRHAEAVRRRSASGSRRSGSG